ncbi:MAG: hypothetical protein FWE83_04970 [Oscillospiraceae bacterium]|nr:hypothetical protein [Oscillospiraceae bacterium]
MENNTLQPAISIDYKQNRIRIYKRTLRLIGNPDYIILLINPEEQILIILSSDKSDKKAFHTKRLITGNKQSYEISSKHLLRKLLAVCTNWQDNRLYRVYGEVVPNQSAVQFRLTDAFIACGTKG